jgi:hypothetical protein
MRLFRRSPQPPPPQLTPEFGIHVTLRRGDKIVRRDARGAIRVTCITEECVQLTDVGRPAPSASGLLRRRV